MVLKRFGTSLITLVGAKSWVFGPDSIHLRSLPAAAPRGSAQSESCRTDYSSTNLIQYLHLQILRQWTREHG
eukprot:4518719-Prymnesium_polylepis.1